MRKDRITRIVGLVIFALLGYFGATSWGWAADAFRLNAGVGIPQYTVLIVVLGALIGFFVTPYITVRPYRALLRHLEGISVQALFASLLGLIFGLVIALLLTYPLSLLPAPLGGILPLVIAVLLGFTGVSLFSARRGEIFGFLGNLGHSAPENVVLEPVETTEHKEEEGGRTILLDTSVIIDGRILDVVRTGFLSANLLIPRFILNELQYIADSADSLRRQRGRRGMEVLNQLQKEPSVKVQIMDLDVEGVREADEKLVILARQLRCPILTNDFNLNRVAELQGVHILNLNELANAVKAVVLPGERLSVRVIQEGKEPGQGVGYMDDGTMVVIDNGRDLIGRDVSAEVTKVLQTAAGRMIFARPVDQRQQQPARQRA
jgi:uncharacterized protein YacL